jgi:hypothetical protein
MRYRCQCKGPLGRSALPIGTLNAPLLEGQHICLRLLEASDKNALVAYHLARHDPAR